MGSTSVIDNFLSVFTSYIDSGFGLLGGLLRRSRFLGALVHALLERGGQLLQLLPYPQVLLHLVPQCRVGVRQRNRVPLRPLEALPHGNNQSRQRQQIGNVFEVQRRGA